jgi:hypothetical protein
MGSDVPTIDELDAAIDYLETLLRKYWNLLRGMDTPESTPVWQYDWTTIFTAPWIKQDAE